MFARLAALCLLIAPLLAAGQALQPGSVRVQNQTLQDGTVTSWVEIKKDGQWLPLCGDMFASDLDALTSATVCKALGFLTGWSQPSKALLAGVTASATLQCTSEDASGKSIPTSCSTTVGTSCRSTPNRLPTKAGVLCSKDGFRPPSPPPPTSTPSPALPRDAVIRLVQDGFAASNLSEGIVEVKYGASFGTICDFAYPFSDAEATVVCNRMGFKTGVPVENVYGFGSNPVMRDVACTPGAASLSACNFTYSTEQCQDQDMIYPPVAVKCSGRLDTPAPTATTTQRPRLPSNTVLRLVNGAGAVVAKQGIVEVKYNGGSFGTLCDAGGVFGNLEARVLCRRLGYNDGTALANPAVSTMPRAPVVSNFKCGAGAQTLLGCLYQPTDALCCTRGATRIKPVAISCTGKKAPLTQ